MNFTCSGVIVGYRAAGIRGNPVIQVWRKNGSLYYNTTAGIVIDGDLCIGGLKMCTDLQDDELLCCDLNQTTTNVPVQPGDILGLKLPHNSGLAFAGVSRAPTNYVFRAEASSPLALSTSNSYRREIHVVLPQITLQIESGRFVVIYLDYLCSECSLLVIKSILSISIIIDTLTTW
jgi:hypothetical protein